ncbi:MAG: hypothetical protein ABSC48_07310 [Terracidiphilus sp.]
MKRILLAIIICAIWSLCTAAQGVPKVSEPANPVGADCVDFSRHLNWKPQQLPLAFRKSVPASALVRMVQALSRSDTLVIYEKGNLDRLITTDHQGVELTAPNTQLVVFRGGKIVFHIDMKDTESAKDENPTWWADYVAMDAARICKGNDPLIYLVLQSGNSGGFFVAMQPWQGNYKMVQISDAGQGRLVLSKGDPTKVKVWDAAEPGQCTACPKPFIVKTFHFDGSRFQMVSSIKTRQAYSGFQETPLAILP